MQSRKDKEDKEMKKAKGLTYEELIELAKQNYNKGGDGPKF